MKQLLKISESKVKVQDELKDSRLDD